MAGPLRRDIPRVNVDRPRDEALRSMSEKNTPAVAMCDEERHLGRVCQGDIAEAITRLRLMPAPEHDGATPPRGRRAAALT